MIENAGQIHWGTSKFCCGFVSCLRVPVPRRWFRFNRLQIKNIINENCRAIYYQTLLCVELFLGRQLTKPVGRPSDVMEPYISTRHSTSSCQTFWTWCRGYVHATSHGVQTFPRIHLLCYNPHEAQCRVPFMNSTNCCT